MIIKYDKNKKKRWKCYEYIFKKLLEYKFFKVCKFGI